MNNGLKIDTTLNDYGRGSITHKKEDSLLFKTPSLRNLAFSSPYMHDGRFRKLSQVLHHYAEEIEPYQNISEELKRPMVLTSDEKVDIIAFLNTLNDKEFVFKKEYGFPKKN
jgi:cytochrome c peroxidase